MKESEFLPNVKGHSAAGESPENQEKASPPSNAPSCWPLVFPWVGDELEFDESYPFEYKTCAYPIPKNSLPKFPLKRFGMWESGGIKYVKVVLDPDNPDCVCNILPSESGADNQNTSPQPDLFGYVGYIVLGKFIYAEQISRRQYFNVIRCNRSELMAALNVLVGKAQVPVVSENIGGENAQSQLSEIARDQIESACKSGELRSHDVNFVANVKRPRGGEPSSNSNKDVARRREPRLVLPSSFSWLPWVAGSLVLLLPFFKLEGQTMIMNEFRSLWATYPVAMMIQTAVSGILMARILSRYREVVVLDQSSSDKQCAQNPQNDLPQ